jgi:hypothetical protein
VLGQKVCPWSKQLVIESHKLSPSSDNRFVGQITQFFLEHKLKAYILEREVKHMLEFEG